MPKYFFLDTGPLSNCVVKISPKPGTPLTPAEACRTWLTECERAGAMVLVPAIAYYECLLEIERRRASAQKTRLQQYCFQPGRFMPLTTTHLEDAALLLAEARRTGTPLAHDEALDADVILCALVQSFVRSLGIIPADYIVATTNTRHLTQFVNAAEWQTITPGNLP
jgi:hypothetical protein